VESWVNVKKLNIENIKLGDFAIIEKKMLLEDVVKFAGISLDFNPIHLNKDYAEQSRYKGQIVHGLMASSLFSGLFGTELPGEGCVYKSQSLNFKRAIYINDIVLAKVEIVKVDKIKKTLSFRTVCSVKNKVVIDGQAEIFIP
jgi:3-hydroxybutyryl-CoA dehydratase